MIGNFLLISEAELRMVLDDPHKIYHLTESSRLDARPQDFVSVDKAWHCIHFLLTGTAWEGDPPLNFVAVGGEVIGDVDVGYGPARGFDSSALIQVATAFSTIDRQALVERFDSEKMDSLEIYPAVGSWREVDPRSEASFGYYTGAFEELKALCLKGQAAGQALLVWIN